MTQFPSRPTPLEYGHDDTGARILMSFFHQVYLWMAVGLGLTAVVAYAAHLSPQLMGLVYGSDFGYVAIGLGAFAVAWFFPKIAMNASLGVATAVYLVYCTIIGLLICGIFHAYPDSTIFAAFLLTGGVFGVMSILGFVLKIDLSRIGAIAGMCVLGLFMASIVNILFVKSDALSWIVTYGVVVLFVILTAYHTQSLKNFALEHGADSALAPRVALIGSLSLYIAFINLFLAILRILGSRR